MTPRQIAWIYEECGKMSSDFQLEVWWRCRPLGYKLFSCTVPKHVTEINVVSYLPSLRVSLLTRCEKFRMQHGKQTDDVISTRIVYALHRILSAETLTPQKTKRGHQMRRAEFHSTQISYRCSQAMLPRPLKAMIRGECFLAVWLGNIAHRRDRICKWDKISVTASKVPPVRSVSCRTTGR